MTVRDADIALRCLVASLATGLAGGWACGQQASTPRLSVHDGPGLQEAVARAVPGTRIELAPGEYGGGHFFDALQGTAGAPIVIAAADPEHPPTFTGGTECLHLSDPAYVELHHLRLSGASGNGLNIDDGGSFATPAHHVLLRGLTVTDVGPVGNRDGIKLSGVDDFRVADCLVERWGDGGSGIDMVGCHRGEITGCRFRHEEGAGASGIQAKGGTGEVCIHGNRFEQAGARAVNIGGSTGLEYFRPRPEGFEARAVTVERNLFAGGEAPVAFVGVDGATVRLNTIYRPTRWVLRILQETRAPGFVPCRNGVFTDNLVVFRTDEVVEAVNIGPDTAPQTFRFARNCWYALDDPGHSAPHLPTPEEGGIVGRDPLLVDPQGGDLRVQPGSPAASCGAWAPR
ncbi:MAG: right-handed parallel beta-helix repeat-containing protein [Candidatus Latescibacterota bacterium]